MPELITSQIGNLQGAHVCELGPQIGNELLKGRRGGHGRQCVGRCWLQTTQSPSPRFHFATQGRQTYHTDRSCVSCGACHCDPRSARKHRGCSTGGAACIGELRCVSPCNLGSITRGNNFCRKIRKSIAFFLLLRAHQSPVTLVACDRTSHASHVCKIHVDIALCPALLSKSYASNSSWQQQLAVTAQTGADSGLRTSASCQPHCSSFLFIMLF